MSAAQAIFLSKLGTDDSIGWSEFINSVGASSNSYRGLLTSSIMTHDEGMAWICGCLDTAQIPWTLAAAIGASDRGTYRKRCPRCATQIPAHRVIQFATCFSGLD